MERTIADNWSVLVSAPVAFVAALCLGAVAGWAMIGLIYNQRLTHYQELIANYRDVLDEKLPTRALRPFPIKRSKQMSVGLILIFLGIGASLIGAILVFSDRSPSPLLPHKMATTAPLAESQPSLTQEPSDHSPNKAAVSLTIPLQSIRRTTRNFSD
jgi:hypothetical protein